MASKKRGIVVLGVGLTSMALMGLGCSMEVSTKVEDLGEMQLALGGGAGTGMSSGGTSSSTVSVSFSNGASYSGTRDAQISSTSPGSNFGLTTGCSVSGGEVAWSCLVKWDLSSVPTNAVIDSAYVRFDFYNGSVSSFDIHQINGSWQEFSVNWTKRDAVNNWSSPGCNSVPTDRTSAPVATFVGTPGTQSVFLNGLGRAMIQNWLANPAANKGIVIRSATGSLDGLSFRTAQYSDATRRPIIGFSYHLP